jgi:insertion element IS1 protein InsB
LQYISQRQSEYEIRYDIVLFEEVEEAELDEMWSFVFSKENPRWLWLAIDHQTRQVLAYTFGRRKDEVFRAFQKLLDPFGISIFYTDDWGSYERNIPQEKHVVGKKNTQTIECKILPYEPESRDYAAKLFAFQNPCSCMTPLWGHSRKFCVNTFFTKTRI